MGIVEEVGPEVTHIKAGRPGRRAVQHLLRLAAGCARAACSPSARPPRSREQGKGAALFGYTSLYGAVPGGQAEYLRVPQAHFGPIKVPDGHADERFLYLSDILPDRLAGGGATPTCRRGGTLAVLGLGPVGQFGARIGRHLGAERVIGVDLVPERLRDGRARTASRCST